MNENAVIDRESCVRTGRPRQHRIETEIINCRRIISCDYIWPPVTIMTTM